MRDDDPSGVEPDEAEPEDSAEPSGADEDSTEISVPVKAQSVGPDYGRGRFVVAGFALLVAAFCAWWGESVAPALGGLAIAGLALVATDTDYLAPRAFNLPGVPRGIQRFPGISNELHMWSCAAGAVGVATVGILPISELLAALLTVAVVVAVAVMTYRRARPWLKGQQHLRLIHRALLDYAPTTVMPYAGRSGGPWQLRMWEPYVVASGERNLVVNLHPKYTSMILKGAHLTSPMIQLGSRETGELDQIFVPSIKAAFYIQNAIRNRDYLAYDDMTHVWLNHGDSDKPANFNPRHAMYERLVVCGQAGIDRYHRHGIDIPVDRFDVLGRPQSQGVHIATQPISEIADKTVLYAPTWQGVDETVNFSSLERGPEIVAGLLERGATVYFRPHPLSYRWKRRRAFIEQIRTLLDADATATGRQHRYGDAIDKDVTITDLTNTCDALVSDVSSVVTDFLASGQPYAMTSMHTSAEEFREEYPVAQTGYVIEGDLNNLSEALDDLLFRDPLASQRDARRRYVLGDLDGEQSAAAFAEYVRTVVGAS